MSTISLQVQSPQMSARRAYLSLKLNINGTLRLGDVKIKGVVFFCMF